MTNRIRAINATRPKLERGPTVRQDELTEYIARHTGLNEGEIALVLLELRDAVAYHCRAGRGVKLDGLGTYLPSMQLDGSLDIEHRLDRALRRGINMGRFTHALVNQQNIGKTPDELVALWNAEHPDDPVD